LAGSDHDAEILQEMFKELRDVPGNVMVMPPGTADPVRFGDL
jgi:hypothetical protein